MEQLITSEKLEQNEASPSSHWFESNISIHVILHIIFPLSNHYEIFSSLKKVLKLYASYILLYYFYVRIVKVIRL